MGRHTRLVLLYSLFATIATAANLLSQALVATQFQGPFVIEVSVVIGTAVGLPIKYVLDKKYIFRFTTNSIWHDSRLFALYLVMAIVTTSIFWGMEALFQILFDDTALRLLGGGLGLAIGYVIKYHLDKRLVFIQPSKRE